MANAQLRFDAENRANVQLLLAHTTEVDRWIAERHYLKSAPACAMLRFWVRCEGEIVGAMLWNHPSSSHLDQVRILELTRMVFIDETPRFIESRGLGMARSHIRKHLPKVKGLLAYSSTGQGHEGTVYEADGWFSIGRAPSDNPWGGQDKRPGRADRDLSAKIRWVRSP